MSIDPKLVKQLRDNTGAGMMDAKVALEEAGGDMEKAVTILRQKGQAKAAKKADRETSNGLIEAYVHGGKIGVLVEINCETDFVARTDDFQQYARDIAMQIAASNPQFVKKEDVDPDIVQKERDIISAEVKQAKKPAEIAQKMIDGRLDKYLSEICLADQPFVKDPSLTITELTTNLIAKLGENIVIARFTRYELGD